MRKLIAILTLLLMVISLTPVQAVTEKTDDGTFTYEITEEGTATLTGVVNSYPVGELTIPETFEGYPVTVIARSAFSEFTDITAVNLPNTLLCIEPYTFEGCIAIESITIPDSVKQIGEKAFYGCSGLKNITLPDTALQIDHNSFQETGYALNSENWDDGVLYIGIHLITAADGREGPCTVKAGTLTIADNAFRDVYEIKAVSLPVGLKRIGENAFYFTNMESLTIPASVETVGDSAFSGSDLKTLTIENGVKHIGDSAFYDNKLTTVTIPGSVQTIGEYAFDSNELESVFVEDGVKEIGGYAFDTNFKLSQITLPTSLEKVGAVILNGTAYYEDVKNWKAGLLCVGDCLLAAKDDMTGAIVVPDGIRIIADRVFEWNIAQISVTLPDSIKYIGAYAFSAYGLTQINFPDGLISIGNEAFKNASLTGDFVLPNSVKYIGDYAFEDCSKITSIVLPDTITYLGAGAFSSCYNIEKINIPSGITEILPKTFYFCTSLQEITIPDGITLIHEEAFYFCEEMITVHIGEGVVTIGENVFGGCNKIETTYLPSTVKYIGNSAFNFGYGPTEIIFNGTQEEFDKITIGEKNRCIKDENLTFAAETQIEETEPDGEVTPDGEKPVGSIVTETAGETGTAQTATTPAADSNQPVPVATAKESFPVVPVIIVAAGVVLIAGGVAVFLIQKKKKD